jgi:uncharacterized iron-regulated protein
MSLYLKVVHWFKCLALIDHRIAIGFLVLFLILLSPLESKGQGVSQMNPTENKEVFLLGEVHDNTHAHQLRLDLVNRLIRLSMRPTIAMEQFDHNRQSDLDLALSRCQDVECVIKAAGTSGWNWLFYKPLVQLALDGKVTLIAANLADKEVKKVIKEGFAAVFTSAEISTFKLDQIPLHIQEHQSQFVREGHCNMLPPQANAPMVNGQIARDVLMANVINNSQADLIILIAGNGHVRKDIGVFQWLTSYKQMQTQVHGYVEQDSEAYASWFDEVHVVDPIDRDDPCKVFSKMK